MAEAGMSWGYGAEQLSTAASASASAARLRCHTYAQCATRKGAGSLAHLLVPFEPNQWGWGTRKRSKPREYTHWIEVVCRQASAFGCRRHRRRHRHRCCQWRVNDGHWERFGGDYWDFEGGIGLKGRCAR